jgi:hypothetical protein
MEVPLNNANRVATSRKPKPECSIFHLRDNRAGHTAYQNIRYRHHHNVRTWHGVPEWYWNKTMCAQALFTRSGRFDA